MKIIIILTTFMHILIAQDIELKYDGLYKILSNVHLVDDITYKRNQTYQALIEIPAGSTAKWEVNHKSGNLEWEFKNKKPRIIHFLGYPGNYGYIPQTVLNKKEGGDGDPLDVLVLDGNVKRGYTEKVKILGGLALLDEGEHDDKLIAVMQNGVFKDIKNLEELMMQFPGLLHIVRIWFEGYDKGSMQFMGYISRSDAEALIEEAHKQWRFEKDVH